MPCESVHLKLVKRCSERLSPIISDPKYTYLGNHPTDLFSEPPLSPFSAMGVAAEPGQKGINWSNIAVGEYIFLVIVLVFC